MYAINLNAEESKQLKRIIKQMMIKKGYSVKDLSDMTGYAEQTIYDYLSMKNTRKKKFVAAALCDVLEITVRKNG